MEDCLEGWVGLDGFVEAVGGGDVGYEDVVEARGVLGVRGEEFLGFVGAADGDADRVAVFKEDIEDVGCERGVNWCWWGGV